MDIMKLVGFGLVATLLISVVSYYDGKSNKFGNVIRLFVVPMFMIFIVALR